MRGALADVGGVLLRVGFAVDLNLFASSNKVSSTSLFGELVVTFTTPDVVVRHLPLFQGATCEVFAEEDIETRVDCLQRLVAHEDGAIKTFQGHADFGYIKPTILAACMDTCQLVVLAISAANHPTFRGVWRIKSMASAISHGSQELISGGAEGLSRNFCLTEFGRLVQGCSSDGAGSSSSKLVEIAGRLALFTDHLLLE